MHPMMHLSPIGIQFGAVQLIYGKSIKETIGGEYGRN